MDTFEIRDEEINVEEIMQKIRERIKRRKERSRYPEENLNIIYELAENFEYIYGWHEVEDWDGTPTRWMGNEAILVINSSRAKNAELNFKARSFIRPRSLKISDGNHQDTSQIVPTTLAPIKIPIRLIEGPTIIRFKVLEGGDRPCDISENGSEDGRCLSIAVQDISILAPAISNEPDNLSASSSSMKPMAFTPEILDVGSMRTHLQKINSACDIDNDNYNITSHRLITGKILVKGRELVHGEVKRYVDSMILKQNEFNHGVVDSLNDTVQKIDVLAQMLIELGEAQNKAKINIEEKIERKIETTKTEIGENIERSLKSLSGKSEAQIIEQITSVSLNADEKTKKYLAQTKAEILVEVDSRIGNTNAVGSKSIVNAISKTKNEISREIQERIEQAKAEIVNETAGNIGMLKSEIDRRIDEHIHDVVTSLNNDLDKKAWLARVLDRRMEDVRNSSISSEPNDIGINYFLFEERFRSPRKEIKQRQSAFLEYFRGCKNVLDIGCGRGEFLELLQENSIVAQGVDVDEDMVKYCTLKGLKVARKDALSFIEGLEDKSLDGIFLDQVVEHLDPAYLVKMLAFCYKKLNYGYYIVIETVNTLSLTSFANFYVDMTHKRPMHPETLKFLLESIAFREIETKFFSPLPEGMKLKKIGGAVTGGMENILVDAFNYNVEMLNHAIFGAQDYMIAGKK